MSASGESAAPLNRIALTMGHLASAIDTTSRGFGFSTGLAIIVGAIIIMIEVISRGVFNHPTSWTSEVTIWLMIAYAFTSVAFGLKEGAHIRVEAITSHLAADTQEVLRFSSLASVLIYSAVFSYYAVPMVTASLKNAEVGLQVLIPVWPIKAILLTSMVLISLQAVRMMFHSARLLKGIKPLKIAIPLVILIAITVIFGYWLPFYVEAVHPFLSLMILNMVLLAAGIPVAFGLGIVSMLGLIFIKGGNLQVLLSVPQIAYSSWSNFEMMALPFFIFMGNLMFRSGIGKELLDFTAKWVGHLPGGMAIATLAGCAIFAAMSGSSIANAATIGLISIPILVSMKYGSKMACGIVAAGGTMGILIPPSTAMIMYGILTEQSIGHLFIAGLIPGILLFIMLSLVALLWCKWKGNFQPMPKISWKERLTGTKEAMWGLLLPIYVLGGIYSGFFTPTESAAGAVIYGLIYMLVIKRSSIRNLVTVMRESTNTVAMICIAMSAAIALAEVTTMLQVGQDITRFLISFDLPGWAFIAALMVLFIILGMFMGANEITLITIPIIAPVLISYGYDLVWFAVPFVITMEIGLLTPPIGINCFVVQQISGYPLTDVLRGMVPFLIALLIVMLLTLLIPQLSLWLPSTMG